jgi:ABC-type phosphate transport system substrate-binding protein
VKKFLSFYFEQAAQLVKDVGYVPLKAEAYKDSLSKIK